MAELVPKSKNLPCESLFILAVLAIDTSFAGSLIGL